MIITNRDHKMMEVDIRRNGTLKFLTITRSNAGAIQINLKILDYLTDSLLS